MATPLYHYVSPIIYRTKVAPNILARIQLPALAVKNRYLFHPYVVADGDRPDTIAALYYGNDLYDWVVLLSNQIVDMRNEWPLEQNQFEAAIVAKYGNYSAAAEISYYEIDTSKATLNTAGFESLPSNLRKYYTRVSEAAGNLLYGITKADLRINANSLAALDEAEQSYWVPVTFYEDEFRQNEIKRHIRLIDAQYIPQLEKSLRQISRDVIS